MPSLQIEVLTLLVGFVVSLAVTVVAIYLVLSLRMEQRIDVEKQEIRGQMKELRNRIRRLERRVGATGHSRRSAGAPSVAALGRSADGGHSPGAP